MKVSPKGTVTFTKAEWLATAEAYASAARDLLAFAEEALEPTSTKAEVSDLLRLAARMFNGRARRYRECAEQVRRGNPGRRRKNPLADLASPRSDSRARGAADDLVTYRIVEARRKKMTAAGKAPATISAAIVNIIEELVDCNA